MNNNMPHLFKSLSLFLLCNMILVALRLFQQASGISMYYDYESAALDLPQLEEKTSSLHPDLKAMFGVLADPPLTVTAEDRRIGAEWKTYMYPLEQKFHTDVFKKINKGCILEPCPFDTISGHGIQYLDHESEAVILSKLLSSLEFVDSPEEADLFLVPALTVTASNTKPVCRRFGRCNLGWYEELFQQLEFLQDSSKPHLFLATQDWSQNHPSIAKKLYNQENALVVNLGPGGIVVPFLNTNINVQDPTYTSILLDTTAKKRDIFIMANMGVRHEERTIVAPQLERYKGTRKIKLPKDPWRPDEMFGAVFTLCLSGDLPATKRFFDAILSLSIPVVIDSQVSLEGTNETFRTFWHRNDIFFADIIANHSVAASYPDISFTGVSYDDFLVTLSAEEAYSDIVGALERVYNDKTGMKKRRDAMRKIRDIFLFNLRGDAPDAFTALLCKLHAILKPNVPTPVVNWSLKTPAKHSSSTHMNCGCPRTCNVVEINTMKKDMKISCFHRIEYMMAKHNVSQDESCTHAGRAGFCGPECTPGVCATLP